MADRFAFHNLQVLTVKAPLNVIDLAPLIAGLIIDYGRLLSNTQLECRDFY
jgi:hypothetical protein